jgi:hypothetical protein
MILIHIKWVLAIIVTILCFIWAIKSTKHIGDDYGLSIFGVVPPLFVFLLFWIVWLIIFK